ncbi:MULTISPECIES: HPr family phosphocarrier protein [Mediterraneibacter]|uniref:HPr family phosphocarrier protein n=1 Tax=Mediterraneibacter TaxID=2316020 RepID=UPI0022E676CA|nr:HPr family phosphocarrier protein [Mediterraneibacter massiliensis]
MQQIKVKIKFKEGLHARPAVQLIKLTKGFLSAITLEKGEKIVSAGSIMAILGACIVYGDEIIVRAEGPDEEKAIQELEKYFS